MTKYFFKVFLITIVFKLTACSTEPQKAKIRIVDLQGNYKPVLTKVPDFNAQVLDGQESQFANVNKASQEQQSTTIIPEKRDNYSNHTSQQIAQSLQFPSDKTQNKNFFENIKNKEKDNMIFAGRQDEKIISEYDLANSKDDVSAQEMDLKNNKQANKTKEIFADKDVKSKNKLENNSSKKYFVQVGSYSSKDVADEQLKNMKKFHRGKVELSETQDHRMYRVLLGPFTSKPQARKVVSNIVKSGFEAILVKGN
jgi:cell division protein FtsN